MASYREQCAALAAMMAGRPCPLDVDDFGATLAAAYSVIKECEGFAQARRNLEAMLSWPMVRDVLAELPADRPSFPSLEELAAGLRPVEWLWEGWIPQGMLSLLGAAPGAGKSFLALDLARRIIEGGVFPDGTTVGDLRRAVIYVDAENVPQLLNERADAWGMDKGFLFPMLPDDEVFCIDLCEEKDRDRLWEMCGDLEPSLVVVDSLGAASSKGENAVEEVRGLLAFLNTVAVDFDLALLLIHHLRKGRTPMLDLVSINDFRGSGHIVAMARSILGLSIIQETAEMDRNGPRRLEVVKTNLAQYPKPIGVEFRTRAGGGVDLVYGKAPKRHKALAKVEQCMEWIREVLYEAGSEGVKVSELVEMAEEEEYERRMVFRARKRMGEQVGDTEGRKHPENRWVLVDEADMESFEDMEIDEL